MSEASRAIALQHAATIHHGSGDAQATLETAQAFHDFMSADSAAKPAATKPAATKPAATPAKKPVPAKKPTPPADDDAEADEGEEAAAEGEVTKEEVGEAIEALLNANLRDKAVALFKKYKAKSLSSVQPEDYAAIKQEAEDALLSA